MKDADCASDKTPSFEKTWGSSTSSGYCSDDDSEFEQYFTARTSFIRKPKTEKQVRRDKLWWLVGLQRHIAYYAIVGL